MSPASISTLRFILRIANAFLVDLLTTARGERDFTDALILAVLVQSNTAALTGDRGLEQRYASIDAPPPAEIRRPISINGISASLGVPFETVRRRVHRLAADGVCEATPEGVRFSDAALRRADHRRAVEATYALVRRFYLRLQRAGCIQLMELPEHGVLGWTEQSPPVRIVWRAASDYLLRMMEFLLPNAQSLSQAFISLAVVRANTAHLPDELRGAEGFGPEHFISDSDRKPARTSEVATLLGLPHETVRRNLAALVEEGRCVRVQGGFVVPAAVLARPRVLAATPANFRYLARMFAQLAELGVLAHWDAEASADQTAA